MRWMAIVALVYSVGMTAWASYMAVSLDAARTELTESKRQVETYKRLQNADISRGDASDDLDWLCKRSRKGCP